MAEPQNPFYTVSFAMADLPKDDAAAPEAGVDEASSTQVVNDADDAAAAGADRHSDSDDSDNASDDDVAPGRENKKRPRSDSSSTTEDGKKKLAKGNDGGGATETVTITIPSELAGAVIGRSGTVIRATREASGASVHVAKEEISAGLREVTLSGTPGQIAAAKALVTTQVEAKKASNAANPPGPGGGMGGGPRGPGTMTTVMQVESGKIGGLIGKRGAVINDIRKRSGCRINVQDSRPGQHGPTRDVTITGALPQIQIAQQMIAQKLQEVMSTGGPGMGGPGGMGGPRMGGGGYGGGHMNNMHQQWGHGGPGGPPPMGGHRWPGPPMGPVTTTQVSVPDDHVGRLIGRGGETINRIRQQSGCRIDIAKNDGSNTTGLRIVTLSGDQSAIMRAQDMLRQKLAEAQQQAAGGGGGGYGGGGGGGGYGGGGGGAAPGGGQQAWSAAPNQAGYGAAAAYQGGYGVGGYAAPPPQQGGYVMAPPQNSGGRPY